MEYKKRNREDYHEKRAYKSRRHGSWYEDRSRRVVRNQSDENYRYENDAVTEITESDSESFYCESVTSNSSPRRCVSRSNSRGRSESSDSEIQCSKVVPLPANAVLPSTSPKKRKPRGVLPIDYWERSPECQEAKFNHMDRLDRLCDSRERLVLYTTLYRRHTALEPNMFPYNTPPGVKHYTLWCRDDMTHSEICDYMEGWLDRHMPHVKRWNYDDNAGEKSIQLFHVHVYIETDPDLAKQCKVNESENC